MDESDKLDVCGLVLAGGRGSRMGGQDKGLVEYQDKPLVEHVIARVQARPIYISANRNQQQYQQYCDDVVGDEMPNYQGPLSGILSVMLVKKHDWYFVVPCDTPHLPDNLFQRLASYCSDHLLIAAHDGERLQALCVLIHCSQIDSLKVFMESGQRRVMTWLEGQACLAVDFSGDGDAFKNVNRTIGKGF